MIARFQINLLEVPSPLEPINKVINLWDWILVPDSDFFSAR